MAIETTIQITLKSNSPFETKDKTTALISLSKLSPNVLKKMAELSKSSKAISQIENNFEMIKSFIA